MDAAGKCLLYDEFRTNHSNKEKSHVVHHHRNSNHSVVARLFRFEHKSKFPENGRVDSHSGCSCRHPYHFESVRDHLVSHFFENKRQLIKLPLHTKEQNSENEVSVINRSPTRGYITLIVVVITFAFSLSVDLTRWMRFLIN